jgi:integrase
MRSSKPKRRHRPRADVVRLRYAFLDRGQASIRPFSESQVEDLLASARDQQDDTLLMPLVHTGIRPGEASALRWSDFDFTASEILVERSLDRGCLGTPKTGRQRRVDMSLELAKALTSLYTIREREKLQGQRTETPNWTFCDRAQPAAYPKWPAQPSTAR